MRLVPINPPMADGSRVQCCMCLRMADAATTCADLDGEAFVAFYCRTCTALLRHRKPCEKQRDALADFTP